LEFIVEFPESETLKFDELNAILNDEGESDCSVDILKKADKE